MAIPEKSNIEPSRQEPSSTGPIPEKSSETSKAAQLFTSAVTPTDSTSSTQTTKSIQAKIQDGQSDTSSQVKNLASEALSIAKKTAVIGVEASSAQELINAFALLQEQLYIKEKGASAFNGKSDQEKVGMLREWLMDNDRVLANQKPRIELRLVPGTNPPTYANIALAFADTKARDAQFNDLKQRYPELSLVSAGKTTLEIGSQGVDKATVINYVSHHFDEILDKMHYQPGPLIDARTKRSVIIADADGTIWDTPSATGSPEATNLSNSAAKESILSYLRGGGILILNSGNDPQRTVNRLLVGIPQEERLELLSRVAIAAAGGHVLMTLGEDGTISEIPDYRANALQETQQEPSRTLDALYIGDDVKATGNDFAAFIKMGPDHFICVPSGEKIADAAPQLKHAAVPGEVATSSQIFRAVVDKATILPQDAVGAAPLFDDVPTYVTLAKSIPEAHQLIEDTFTKLAAAGASSQAVQGNLHAKGRQQVDAAIHYNDAVNGPTRYEKDTINEYIRTFDFAIRKHYTLASSPTAQGDSTKSQITLNYDNILRLNADFLGALEQSGIEAKSLYNSFDGVEGDDISFEQYMEAALDRMGPKNGDTIRILEPGNNDQATPMFIAQQIQYIKKYEAAHSTEENPLKLNIEVLVMGRGGHATTSTFPQIGELKRGETKEEFLGIPEAESLSGTLVTALNQLGIQSKITETFDPSPADIAIVQIKLAKESTNTGENVKEAINCDPPGAGKPQHIFVAAARTAATRQALTFAQQYAKNKADPTSEKYYTSISSIPYSRSQKFVTQALSDHQAVTEFYAGLAEQCRSIQYGFNPDNPFIPASPIDQEQLDKLYSTYCILSGKTMEVAKAEKFGDITAFFSKCFTVMEKSIPMNKNPDKFQTKATEESVRIMTERSKTKAEYKKSITKLTILNEYRNTHKLTDDENKIIDKCNVLREKLNDPSADDRIKKACMIMLSTYSDKLDAIIKANTRK